jgi:AraC family transcriptional regulator
MMKRVPIIFEGENPEITAMWKSLTIEPKGMIQASINFSDGRMEEKGELDQYIGVAATEECPENLERIFSEWFPSSNYQVTEGPKSCRLKPKI